MTVTAEASFEGALVDISPPNANSLVDGNQVDLAEGANTITVVVTAEDRSTTQTDTVAVTRPAPPSAAYSRDASTDFSINGQHRGLWSDGTTMWVADGAVDTFAAQSLGGRRSVAGALTGRAASVASAAAALAIAAAVSSRFATSAPGQPEAEVCDYTLQVRDAIVAPADAEACSNA